MTAYARLLEKKWFLGTILLSLGAHTLLLPLPLPPRTSSSSEANRSSNADDAPAIAVNAIPLKQLPKPASAESPPPLPAAPLANPPTNELPQAAVAVTEPINEPPPQPVDNNPLPEPPISEPIEPTPSPETPTPTPTPQPSPDPTPPPTERGMVVALAEEFPHFAGAQAGCFSLTNCHRVSGQGNYRQAAKQLIGEMTAQGYQVEQRDDIDSQGHRVYEVIMPSEPDVTYYLNVFSDSADSMVYAMTLSIVTLAELQQLAG
ncbi:MAG: hypothetical protein AB8B99_16555 [Phormidesmis sp.]